LLIIFIVIYIRITPYKELELIRSGNIAAAISLSGAIIGFVLPLASVVENSVNFPDMLLWSVFALIVQISAFLGVRLTMPQIGKAIPEGKIAQGIFLGVMSLAVGMINAACMTY
jgi:putative membrane protein